MRKKKYQITQPSQYRLFPRISSIALLALMASFDGSVSALHISQRGAEKVTQGLDELQLASTSEATDSGQKTLSQETIEAAAQQATEEAVAEAQAAQLRSATQAELDETSLQGSANMIHALEGQQLTEQTEANAVEGIMEQAGIEQTSAIDTTLDEIKKLRIIDQELAKAQTETKNSNTINEQQIEAQTIQKLGASSTKDLGRVESLVQQQIQDQVNKIDSKETMDMNLDTLEYAANIETKDFLNQDEEEELTKHTKEVVKPAPVKLVKKKVEKTGLEASEAALGTVSIASVSKAKKPTDTSKPLQPSAEATKLDLDAAFSYQPKPKADIYKKPKRVVSPAEEKRLLDNLVQKSVELGRKKAHAPKPVESVSAPHKDDKNSAALALITAKSKAIRSKKHSSHHSKHKKRKHRHGHKHHNHVLMQTSSQLDDLFNTVRENLLSKKKTPPNAQLVQIHNKVKGKDDELTVDEQAEMSLKLTAHQMTKNAALRAQDPIVESNLVAQKDSRDKVLKGLLIENEVEQHLQKQEATESTKQESESDLDMPSAGKHEVNLLKEAAEDMDQEKPKKKVQLEDLVKTSELSTLTGDKTARSLLEEAENESTLQKSEQKEPSDGPEEENFLQLGSQVQAQVQSQIQATVQARAQAAAQAAAASKALAKLGVKQKSQVAAQDQNLIDTLKGAINKLEMQKNPQLAVQAAKKKAVTNIQKALTKKILTRLDDSQPLINVFSKMQSLSKMMPAIQDFERRLGILHQVEPILESAISTLSKVVDLSAPVPAMPSAKPVAPVAPTPPPAPAAPSGGGELAQLQAILAQAEQKQAPQPAAQPAGDSGDGMDLAALLGGGQAAAAPAPAAPQQTGLEALLGGGGEATQEAQPQFATPAFLQPQAAPAPVQEEQGAGGGVETALISKLLGSGM